MTRTILLLTVALVSRSARSQFTFGVRAGANYSFITEQEGPQYSGDRPLAIKYKGIGQDIGAWAEASLSDRAAIRFDPGVSLRRSSRTVSYYEAFSFGGWQTITEDETLRLTYLEAPLCFRWLATDRIRILAGPSFGFLLGGEYINEWTAKGSNGMGMSYTDRESTATSGRRLTKDLRGFETGFMIGCDHVFHNGIVVGARFQRMLSSIENDIQARNTERKYDLLKVFIAFQFPTNN